MWQTKVFQTREAMQRFLDRKHGKIQYEEILVNNAYGIVYRPLRRIG